MELNIIDYRICIWIEAWRPDNTIEFQIRYDKKHNEVEVFDHVKDVVKRYKYNPFKDQDIKLLTYKQCKEFVQKMDLLGAFS